MPKIPDTIQNILGPDGILARKLQGFEFRPSQLRMALLAQGAILRNNPALIEAGTGTGKTFGYLVPVLLSGKKSVISTGTKNLQEQIYFKDIPLLRKVTGLDIDAVMMKGRENYLCLHKYYQYISQPSLPVGRRSSQIAADIDMNPGNPRLSASNLETSQAEKIKKLKEWLKKTEFADRGEIPWLTDDDILWNFLSSSSEQCLGSSCTSIDDCFLGKLRSRAAKAKIIVVNHYLFFADLKVKMAGFGEIIPRFQVAVFDEAHTIEEIATSYFGDSLSTRQLTELISDLKKALRNAPGVDKGKLKRGLNAIQAGSERLKGELETYGEKKGRVDQKVLLHLSQGPGRDIGRALKSVYAEPDLKSVNNGQLQSLLDRARELARLLEEILRKRDSNWLNWYEKRKKSLILHSSPLDISESMNELLYGNIQAALFTSATLSTNGTFDYIRARLGLPESAIQEICHSHFDFETQTMLYIPKRLPAPNKPDFGREAAGEIIRILERTKGRALVLFTSYHNLNLVYEILKQRLPYEIHRQGDAPRSVLLNRFREDIHSVLLATGSFWQGVDVPGESLSCLIIDKLPFDSPGDPVVAARIDAIRSRGANPFMEYQVPSAIISLKQGLGRLIRKQSDRGILSILDVRILTSRYGRFFLESLPHMPVTHNLSDIDRFFNKTDSATQSRQAGLNHSTTQPLNKD